MDISKNENSFGFRLYDSFREKGYDLIPPQGRKYSSAMKKIIKDMIKDGLIGDNEAAALKMKKQITNDVKDTSYNPNIETSTLLLYCKFLGCSADYLLGFTDKRSLDSGLSDKAIDRLKHCDSDTKALFNAIAEDGYIRKVTSVMRSFYAIGNAITINASNQENKKNFDKALENIKLKMLRDSGADFIHKLAYNKKVFTHFMNNAVDAFDKKQRDFYKGYPAAFLEKMEQNLAENRKEYLSFYDEL